MSAQGHTARKRLAQTPSFVFCAENVDCECRLQSNDSVDASFAAAALRVAFSIAKTKNAISNA